MTGTSAARHSVPSAAPRWFVRWVVRHPLGGFIALAYGISWAFFIPAALGAGQGLIILGAFGPATAAWLVTRWTGGSVRAWLGGLTRWRVPLRFYLVALGLPPLLVTLTGLEVTLLGQTVNLPSFTRLVPGYLGTFVAVALLGGGQEEPGWRGFALDRYEQVRSPIGATVALGLVWGAWHLPVYGLGGFGGPVLFVVFYTWLYNRTGSVLLCVLLHASFNTAVGYLDVAHASITVSLVLVGTVVAATAALVTLTRGRLGVGGDVHGLPLDHGRDGRSEVVA